MSGERSPGRKLAIVVLIGAMLAVPLMMVYALLWDRQDQAQTARASISRGWGGVQSLSGPVIVIPYRKQSVETVTENGRQTSRTVETEHQLLLAPVDDRAQFDLDTEKRSKNIYDSVVYTAKVGGQAQFAIPDDIERLGVKRADLMLDRAEIRFGISDPRGLRDEKSLSVDGQALELRPGNGLATTNGSGIFAFFDWQAKQGAPIGVTYKYVVRGTEQISMMPEAASSEWTITSDWPHPGFGGDFLPDDSRIRDNGFAARYAVSNLALGRSTITLPGGDGVIGPRQSVTVDMVQPVNLYNQIDRSVKYGFLFIAFTFVAFLMFDIIGGARVAAAEYLLTGVGLILFFVLLLAFSEVIGFTPAYLLASAAIIGLISAYSSAVLRSRKRGGFIAAMLTGLYALLYVLLNLEAFSLLIGSVLLFVALAGIMYMTRNIDWSGLGKGEEAMAE
ncbi:MAG: cell envelope integrity protein CreD [Blastomonas sp.]